ncbi:hypothetical protein HanPSC8_Chr10g0422751 [Helianthus annuus]|nr:hypothetical protein HanPSC8_Chr10g0422751 [Helianthus annuus]
MKQLTVKCIHCTNSHTCHFSQSYKFESALSTNHFPDVFHRRTLHHLLSQPMQTCFLYHKVSAYNINI